MQKKAQEFHSTCQKICEAELLIGAHTSAQGGAYHALLHGAAIGATTVQLFTRNQKQWAAKPLSEEEIGLFKETLVLTGLKKIMSHDSYLINLGAGDPENLQKSRKAFKEELIRCQQLGISFLNLHPGAAGTQTTEQCLQKICESLCSIEDLAGKGHTRLLLETTAGQGTSVGHVFEHLAYIIDAVHKKVPIGVCIDTCHIFVAGYDIRTKQAWKETLETFDQVIGLKHLYALHVNDSVKPFGSRRDRHASLGKGEIGSEGFRAMMHHPDLRAVPKYLETPDPELWKEEIQFLRDVV
jgi:deoxyribonuclease-4